jgi:hypothetical protein
MITVMKRSPRCLAVCLLLGSSLAAIERLPIEDFTRTPGAARVRLSPDGKMIAFVRDHAGKATMHFIELDNKGNVSRLDLGEAELANGELQLDRQ